ncbi:MAG: TIGR04053 family radical SAM/SPASM domain-containing protein [Candidatus Nanopelagicales bacterium]
MTSVRTSNAVRSLRHSASDRPFLVIWEATRACALACRHCRAEAAPLRDPVELTTDVATELMAQIASFGKPPPIFVITGGDPFERPDLVELVRRGRGFGLPVAVSPSGTERLSAQSLRELQEVGLTAISLSLDGADAGVHDDFRGITGTFDRTLAGWDAALELGLRVQINTTVARHNVGQLADIAALVHGRGAMTWSAFMLVPTGRGTDLQSLEAAEVEDVLNFLYDVGHTIAARTTEGHHFRRVVLERTELERRGIDHVSMLGLGELYLALTDRARELGLIAAERTRRPPINVNAGSGFVFISHHGDVHPSGFLPIGAGNIRSESLTTIYQQSALFVGLRDPGQLLGRCGECEFNTVCGGSRSRALAVTGNVWETDPLCNYQPGSFPFDVTSS